MMNWNCIRQVDDVINKFGTEERIKRFQSGELVLVERNGPRAVDLVLNFERKASVPGGPFVASRDFSKNNPKVRFGHIDWKVPKFFGKVCENVHTGELAVHTILKRSHDPEIMVALGPHSKRFIKLGQLYQLLEAQGQGQPGPLLVTHGYYTVGYVLDENQTPWAVGAGWDIGGWFVNVSSVASLIKWATDHQVLSQVK